MTALALGVWDKTTTPYEQLDKVNDKVKQIEKSIQSLQNELDSTPQEKESQRLFQELFDAYDENTVCL